METFRKKGSQPIGISLERLLEIDGLESIPERFSVFNKILLNWTVLHRRILQKNLRKINL
jgi:hypothetical protein